MSVEQVEILKSRAKSLLCSLVNVVGSSSSQYEFQEKVDAVDKIVDCIVSAAVLDITNIMNEVMRSSTTSNDK